MSEKPKRQWFRFHLLTLVLMSLVAGEVIWLNTLKHTQPTYMESTRTRITLLESSWPAAYGWPSNFMVQAPSRYAMSGGIIYGIHWANYYRWSGLVIDCLVLSMLVGACGALCELLLRHREARKT